MKKNVIIISSGIAVLTIASVIVTMVGLSNTVGELSVEMNRNQVDAILANANVEDESTITVPIMYYDQVMDECVNLYDTNFVSLAEARQFEWSKCEYYNKGLEAGLVEPTLNADFLPIAKGGNLLSNRGMKGDGFDRWFNTVDGKSKNYASTIDLRYDGTTASFSYENDEFYPLNDVIVPDEIVNSDGNNHLFTFNLGVPFEVMGEGKEAFAIAADDDTWVFLDDKIVLDMGGIHGVINGRFKVQENGEIYTALGDEALAYSGVKLAKGERSIVRIFHADRDSSESAIRMSFSNMLLNVTNTILAQNDNGEDTGTTVAYNPENPSYVAPLGESLTYTPDRSKMILTSAITQASVMGALIVVVMIVVSVILRQVRRDEEPKE